MLPTVLQIMLFYIKMFEKPVFPYGFKIKEQLTRWPQSFVNVVLNYTPRAGILIFISYKKKENTRCLTKCCSSWILVSRYEQPLLIPRTSDTEAFIMAPDAQGTLWPLAEVHKALMYLQCKALNQYHTSRQDNKAIVIYEAINCLEGRSSWEEGRVSTFNHESAVGILFNTKQCWSFQKSNQGVFEWKFN